MERRFDKRIHDIKTQNEDIRKLIAHSNAFVETILNPVISKSFSESISLAVTQVNGCKLCSYTHAKNALKAGMTEDEVEMLMSGDFGKMPKEYLEALLFAQHYAETKGNPDPIIIKKLQELYGKEKIKDIMSHILIIMLANLHGNTLEAFKLRLKGEPVEGSSFWQELAVLFNFFKIMPIILFKMFHYKFFSKKIDRKISILQPIKINI